MTPSTPDPQFTEPGDLPRRQCRLLLSCNRWILTKRKPFDGHVGMSFVYSTFVRAPKGMEDATKAKRPQGAASWAMCVIAAHTGARRSEMIRAERQDVDFEAGIITIREKSACGER